jgi:hypothetical protein
VPSTGATGATGALSKTTREEVKARVFTRGVVRANARMAAALAMVGRKLESGTRVLRRVLDLTATELAGLYAKRCYFIAITICDSTLG